MHALYLAIIAILLIFIVYSSTNSNATRITDKRRFIEPKFRTYKERIDNALVLSIQEDIYDAKLLNPCLDALTGGKRVRSILILDVANSNNPNINAIESAVFIEYIHAASLIIDDMPAFDNDAERRGKPSIHAKYGQATAQMAAVSLISAGFNCMCRQIDDVRAQIIGADYIGTQLCREVSRAMSLASTGQLSDISANSADLITLMHQKTAALFELSIVVAWLVSGGDIRETDNIRLIGKDIGIAFQIADDIADMDTDTKNNFALEFGRNEAECQVKARLKRAKKKLCQYNLWPSRELPRLFDKILSVCV